MRKVNSLASWTAFTPDMLLPYVELPYTAPPGYRLRDAELADAGSITDIWYASFNPSHKFWEYATPDDAITRKWFDDLWTMGIKAGPGVIKTLVVEDMSQANKLVAFARIHVPQADGNQDIPMPPFPAHWDPEITEGLFGGMARARARVMGKKPHWMVEFIAIDQAYQNKRLAIVLIGRLNRQADAAGLEVYGDASMKGYAVWKHYGYVEQPGPTVRIPGRLGQFETYELIPVVRYPNTSQVRSRAKV
jgi:hypothetical protein